MGSYHEWLHILASIYLIISFTCSLIILADEVRRPQRSMVMNFVWAITALYAGPLALLLYFRFAPEMTLQRVLENRRKMWSTRPATQVLNQHIAVDLANRVRETKPESQALAANMLGTAAACTLGIVGATYAGFTRPVGFLGILSTLFFYCLCAHCIAGVFEYLGPHHRHASVVEAIAHTIRTNALAIITFQLAVVAWMTVAYRWTGSYLSSNATFWFMLQIGTVPGLLTSYPAHILSLERGVVRTTEIDADVNWLLRRLERHQRAA